MITGLGFQEIILILAIVLIVFGPRRLPELMRRAGQLSREFRRIAWEFRSALDIESLEETRRKLKSDPYENQYDNQRSQPEEEYGKPAAQSVDEQSSQPPAEVNSGLADQGTHDLNDQITGSATNRSVDQVLDKSAKKKIADKAGEVSGE